jgi:hypothetical protein
VKVMQDPEELVVGVAAPRVVAAEDAAAAAAVEGEAGDAETPSAAGGESAEAGE